MGPQELEILYNNQISAHLAEVRRLREQRNADCSKTKHLPAEILSRIFDSLACSGYSPWFPLQWVAATHVCRTWRNVALNEPTLWTDFTNVHPKWLRETFARSKAAPLILQWPIGPTDDLDIILEHVLNSLERIGELRIFSKGSFVDRLIQPAPFLESLAICNKIKLAPNFLGGVAPRLRWVISLGSLPLEGS